MARLRRVGAGPKERGRSKGSLLRLVLDQGIDNRAPATSAAL